MARYAWITIMGLIAPSFLFCSCLLALPLTPLPCLFKYSWPTSTPLLLPSPLLSSPLLSSSLCSSLPPLSFCLSLSYCPLPSPSHALNKPYSILYCCVAGTSGGGDASAWVHGGTPLSYTLPHIHQNIVPLFLSFYKHNNLNSCSRPLWHKGIESYYYSS